MMVKRLKNYPCLYATISRKPEILSRRMNERFKGEGSALLTIVHSLTGSYYLRDIQRFKILSILIRFYRD